MLGEKVREEREQERRPSGDQGNRGATGSETEINDCSTLEIEVDSVVARE